MTLYVVELNFEMVVEADSQGEAVDEAVRHTKEGFYDSYARPLEGLHDLPNGWKESYPARGGDGETPIGDIVRHE